MERKGKRKITPYQAGKKQEGIYRCSNCACALFDAEKKFDSRTGFPSFWSYIGNNVKENFLDTYGRERIQLLCNGCGLHLGHLFPNKNTPTKLRYCINSDSIRLEEIAN